MLAVTILSSSWLVPVLQHVQTLEAVQFASLLPPPDQALDAAINGANSYAAPAARMMAASTCCVLLTGLVAVAAGEASPRYNIEKMSFRPAVGDDTADDGCALIDLPHATMHTDNWWDAEEEWWVCPDMQLEQGVCREVYVDGKLTVACVR
jgi:hypothetical protein